MVVPCVTTAEMVAMVVVLINEQTLNSVGRCSVLELVFGGAMVVVRCWYHVSPQRKWWQWWWC